MTKKTSNKELKTKVEDKKEVAKKVTLPDGEYINIHLFKDGLNYVVGRTLAKELIEMGRAKLA